MTNMRFDTNIDGLESALELEWSSIVRWYKDKNSHYEFQLLGKKWGFPPRVIAECRAKTIKEARQTLSQMCLETE